MLVEQAIVDHYAQVRLTPEQCEQVKQFIVDELSGRRVEAEADRERSERRIAQLTRERAKLLQAH
jgi:hypothetical protein